MQVSTNVNFNDGRVNRYEPKSSNNGFALKHGPTFSQPPVQTNDYQRYEATSTSYVIKSGDTLSAIAKKYGITVEQLYQDNKDLIGDDPNKVYPGQELIIREKEEEGRAVVQPVQSAQSGMVTLAPSPDPTLLSAEAEPNAKPPETPGVEEPSKRKSPENTAVEKNSPQGSLTTSAVEEPSKRKSPENSAVEKNSPQGSLTTSAVEEFPKETVTTVSGPSPDGCLTRSKGVFNGPSGKETYYNLKMNGVVNIMRDIGYSEEEYPYWVREDGAKMLGQYIMVAADLNIRPRGTVLETSLGTAIVCDTGTFVEENQQQVDIAVDW